jgi:pimeloyl-ACP methyl ester carboxylesterase
VKPDWNALARDFAPEAVQIIRERFAAEGSIAFHPATLAAQTRMSVAETERLLDAVGIFTRSVTRKCSQCHFDLTAVGERDTCPECGADFSEHEPEEIVHYRLDRAMPRDVPWVLVVHGMNTRGEWQEELSWLIGRTYRHMVPVAIYKYGKIQPGVMFPQRQRALARKLEAKLIKLSEEAGRAQYAGVPDVIAHSFGTWLVAEALERNPALKIGRLILLGSVVRPNYPWQKLIGRNQIEAVLNHGATKDEWVPRAQFFIPGSGPGGKHGFAPPVTNVPATDFRHSSYFLPDRLRGVFEGVWQPFLQFEVPPAWPETWSADDWKPFPLPVRFLTWLFAFGVLFGVAALVVVIFVLGVGALVGI